MFSQTAEYALRAVVWLARQEGAAQTNRQVAEGTQVPSGYLAKILQSLSRAGLIVSRRGLGGGFAFTCSPDEVTLLDVVHAVDPPRRILECPMGFENHGESLCPLHRRLDDVLETSERMLAEMTLAELLAEPYPTGVLCAPRSCDRGE